MENKWENKQILDTAIEHMFIDLYTTLAGISRGYISVTKRDFGYTKETAQQELLKIDKLARDKVADAYYIYDSKKDDET